MHAPILKCSADQVVCITAILKSCAAVIFTYSFCISLFLSWRCMKAL